MSHYAIDYFLTLGRSSDETLHFQPSVFGEDIDDDTWNEPFDQPWHAILNLKYEAIPINRYPTVVSLISIIVNIEFMYILRQLTLFQW